MKDQGQQLFKALCGYLPYDGLKIYDLHDDDIKYFFGLNKDEEAVQLVSKIGNGVIHTRRFDEIEPILRPLSDLNKELIIEGEKHQMWLLLPTFCKHHEGTLLINSRGYKFDIKKMKFDEIQTLLEHHFDIYGLIEKGLAIDVNTIQS